MSRRRRKDWSPYALPGMQRSLVAALEQHAGHTDGLAERARAVDPSMEAGFRADAEGHRLTAWAARIADRYWVTDPMARVALDASQDMPGFTGEDMPAPTGLLLVEKPLPDKDVTAIGGLRLRDRETGNPELFDRMEPVPVDGFLWHHRGRSVIVWVLVRSSRLSAPLLVADAPLTAFMSLELPVPADFTGEKAFLGPEGASPTSDALGVLSWLSAAWHLMGMPTVAEIREAPDTEGVGPSRAPKGPEQLSAVRLVDLRPMRHVRIEDKDVEEKSRVYRHRWVVRGHWRQQVAGKKRAERRLTWIPSYIKGPEGAPLLTTDTVNVWRR